MRKNLFNSFENSNNPRITLITLIIFFQIIGAWPAIYEYAFLAQLLTTDNILDFIRQSEIPVRQKCEAIRPISQRIKEKYRNLSLIGR
jgi:hypothetical protein